MMEDLIEDVEEFFDFQPKPGGLVDRHRKEKARRAEAEKEREQIDDAIESRSYRAVKVAQQMPEVVAAQTITIGPGASVPILSANPYRYRASVIVATAASTVILAKDQGAGISANGFPLPTGLIFPTYTRAQVWGFNPGGASIQVGVLMENYSPEDGN
jgi:hypothetical protein